MASRIVSSRREQRGLAVPLQCMAPFSVARKLLPSVLLATCPKCSGCHGSLLLQYLPLQNRVMGREANLARLRHVFSEAGL